MSPMREAYLLAAESAAILLADPAVAAGWTAPSALAEFTVGGLAEHLAQQILSVPAALDRSEPTGERVSLLGHYERVTWIGADLHADVNVAIRQSGETAAAEGVEALAAPWALVLEDFLVTRMMEVAVHPDDLAFSVGVPPPELPACVLDPVLALLSSLAVRRHGAPAVLRALSRAERAPATTASWAAAVCAKGYRCRGRPASGPTRTAPAATAAATSCTACALASSGTV